MSDKLKTSQASGPHKELGRLEGSWKGTSKVWFDPSKLEDESPVSGQMKRILDGRFILHEYKTNFKDKPITGMAIIGYHLELGKFQVAWIDSFHNGSAIMFSEGRRGDQHLSVLGSYAYVTPEIEQHWGWRTEIEIVSDKEIIIRAFNISPEGEESRATEIAYTRE
jgi:hypothetical protein